MPSPPTAAVLPLEPSFLRRLESLALVSRKLASGSERGERKSRRAGSGIAFATHRAYAPGDDIRFVDWKVFTRSERLYVKQFEEERDLAVHLLVDCSGSMAHEDGAKLGYAKQLAAALGYIALINLDRVSVQPFASRPLPRLAPLRGRNRALVLLRFLAALEAEGTTDLRAVAEALAVRAAPGSLAYVLTDGFDTAGLLEGADRLRYARVSPVVLLIGDRREAAPALHGELSLVDCESGEQRTLRVTERVLARYRAAYQARRSELLGALAQRQVPTVELSVEVPLERAVLDLLRRGGIVS
ncbi:MAG: hypothetical protein JWN48_2687 [Myxococcaceae bacterium]|nr:hypothetical protein [Myxococcaceae bacterium]